MSRICIHFNSRYDGVERGEMTLFISTTSSSRGWGKLTNSPLARAIHCNLCDVQATRVLATRADTYTGGYFIGVRGRLVALEYNLSANMLSRRCRAAMFLKYCWIIVNDYTVECPSSAGFLQCKPLFVKGESESAIG
eukprot:scaffold122758_cov63-Cyclotella_meneghiniana.AAC.1